LVRAEIVGLALLGIALLSRSRGDSFILSPSSFVRSASAQMDALEEETPIKSAAQLKSEQNQRNRKIFRERLRTQRFSRGQARTTGGAFQFNQRNALLGLGFSQAAALFAVNKARDQGLPLQTFINAAQSQQL